MCYLNLELRLKVPVILWLSGMVGNGSSLTLGDDSKPYAYGYLLIWCWATVNRTQSINAGQWLIEIIWKSNKVGHWLIEVNRCWATINGRQSMLGNVWFPAVNAGQWLIVTETVGDCEERWNGVISRLGQEWQFDWTCCEKTILRLLHTKYYLIIEPDLSNG